ncbi:hypothetical protein MASR1M68_08580 [Elusimicrobiota bacterium]
MNLNKKRFDSTYFIFFAIAIIYAVGNFIWWQINTPVVPTGETAVHFFDVFRDGFIFYNAPLLTYIMRFMFYIFGKEYYDLTIILVNYIFFIITLYFIYKIGTELKDKATGNIAMILFALVPAIYGMSRQYGRKEYHIVTAMTVNIYCLIKTDYFTNRKWSIFYGISVGLGLMIKDEFLAYFFVPFLYIVIVGLKEKLDKIKIINILTATAIGSLIAGWHYFRPLIIKKLLYDGIEEAASIFEFESLRVMTIGLWEDLLSPPIFLIFIIGLIFFILRYHGKYKNVILLWIFVPWTIIMLMPHYKAPEFGAGFIPAMVLIGAVFLSNIKYVSKKIVVIFLIFIGLQQYFYFSYGVLRTELFDVYFKYKKYVISYYNKNNHFMVCSNERTEQIVKLVKHLKNKYPKNSFYYDWTHDRDNPDSELSYMRLNNMDCRAGAYEDNNISSDIIIIIGNPRNAHDIVKLKVDIKLSFYKFADIITKKFIAREFKAVKNNLTEIERNYRVIEVFYIDESKDENKKVTLLGRKDKFPDFSQ